MCGIVGAVAQRDVADILVEGLKRLEYRGYDSAGVAIIDENNQVLAAVGYGLNEAWPAIDTKAKFLSQELTPIGTAYGSVLGEFEGQRLWLLVDMDNEPLYIARYRIAMALVITGLFTILILLLSLNIM